MESHDTCCSIAPYFKIREGKLEEFRAISERMVKETATEDGALYYGFSFCGDEAYCREGYANAEALLVHADHLRDLLGQALQVADLTRFEIHGPEQELAKLREPLAPLTPRYYALEHGFRR
jgi:hypothetical protein